MKFELQTLDSYEDDDLIEEMKRVSLLVEGNLTIKKFNEHSKVHSDTIRKRFNGWANALEKAALEDSISPAARQITNDEIITLTKEIAQKLNTNSLSNEQFTDNTGIGRKAILSRFKSWKEVLDKAGLKPVAHGRRYTDEECFENILNLWMYYGRQPYYAELKQSPSTVGAKAYSRWGNWRKALKAFIEFVSKNENDKTLQNINIPVVLNDKPTKEKSKKRTSRNISWRLRAMVLMKNGAICQLCGTTPQDGSKLHVDHIIPWAKGGETTFENLQILCENCNIGKSDILITDI